MDLPETQTARYGSTGAASKPHQGRVRGWSLSFTASHCARDKPSLSSPSPITRLRAELFPQALTKSRGKHKQEAPALPPESPPSQQLYEGREFDSCCSPSHRSSARRTRPPSAGTERHVNRPCRGKGERVFHSPQVCSPPARPQEGAKALQGQLLTRGFLTISDKPITSQPLGERKAAHKGANILRGAAPPGRPGQGPHPAPPARKGASGAPRSRVDPNPVPRATKRASPGGTGARRPQARSPRPPQPPGPSRPAPCPAIPQAQPRCLSRPTAPSPLRARPGPAAGPAPRLPPPPPEAPPGPASPRHLLPGTARSRPGRTAATGQPGAVTSAGSQRRAALPLPRGRLPMAAPPAPLSSRRLSPPLTTPRAAASQRQRYATGVGSPRAHAPPAMPLA
ncbi:uncharacterized protein LOC135999266 [Caloenas nicobarica]|uniref:uncharacterized protein LOC135999266 n=1 Tax=Caloenas nicobarica TaxID=187106 RepID=UPI0032B87C20